MEGEQLNTDQTKTERTMNLYERVYDYINTRIVRGEWSAHDRLPSIRELARIMDVHRLTVFKAYQLLKNEQKVYVKDKSGYFVSPINREESSKDYDKIKASIQNNMLSDIQQLPAHFQFSQAIIDPNLLPNHFFSEYIKKVFDFYPKILGSYSPLQGDDELRKALAEYFFQTEHLYVSEDEVMITTGAQQAIDLITDFLIKPRDTILVERPTYSVAIDIFRQKEARIVPIDIHASGYDLERVEYLMRAHKPRLFYINPTFHNPTGYTLPAEQRKQLVDLAERYHCVLIDDDPFHDIFFDQKPPHPLFLYDTKGYVIYIRSFSKYISPGLRIAAVCCRPWIMKHLCRAKSLSDNGTPLLNQKIFLHYFFSSRMQSHLEKLRIALSVRKEIMEDVLSETDWQWESPKGGLNLWVKVPEPTQVASLFQRSIERSVSFVPGEYFDSERTNKSWIRLSYSYANEQEIKQGIKKLVSIYHDA
jgi:DNA-binding transcriptional MocR family regulator